MNTRAAPIARLARRVLPPLAFLVLAACAVGPRYVPPVTPPAVWQNAGVDGFVEQDPEVAWWKQFGDAELEQLEARALAGNLDLRIAADRVRQARAVFAESTFDLAPHVPATAGYARSREQQPGFGPGRIDTRSYSAGFDAAWEIDLFGHVRQSIAAARADAGVAEANLRGARVALAAEVARNYFELRGTQRRIEVARENLENQRQTLRLTEVRFQEGRVGELDVARSRARLSATEATLPPLEAAAMAYRYRLAVLAGERPGALDAELGPAALETYARSLPIGSPDMLLLRRPDVWAAERRIAAATARVGVATADLYPRISISGFVGFLSGDIGKLFRSSGSDDARAWSVAPTVSWAAFDLGSVRARLRAQRADADATVADYERVVLAALEETENAFASYAADQSRLKNLAAQVTASRRASEIAGLQYREGVADYLTLLDAQRTQLSAEDDVAQAQAATNVAVALIYKALGGATNDAGESLPRLSYAPPRPEHALALRQPGQ